MLECTSCGMDYEKSSRVGKPGRITVCNDCAEETEEMYTGNTIFCHKTGASLQINKSRALTDYITNSTKLRNKGSNLGNNLKVSGPTKGYGMCVSVAGADSNAKGRA